MPARFLGVAGQVSDSIVRLIDHALLHPTLTDSQLIAGCELARRLRTASVCIKPWAVSLACDLLADSDVAICTVIGFPHGSEPTEVKAFAARTACEDGASELDMVVNVGKVLSRDWEYVAADIRAVVEVAHAHSALAKVIFENEFLPEDSLKIELCRICSDVGADFVKTSTGFGFVPRPEGGFQTIGATDADLVLMRKHAAPHVKLKASGGVRSYADALRVVKLGAARIGTSSTEAIAAGEETGRHEIAGRGSY
ncbi:MAG TPA: deoxyribose-phosphate aldolase [Pirellulales bacterium]|nr:deoxyribose-phosphate aldolase [Pirellulales bacterium]